MPSMLCRPRWPRGPRGILGGASRHSQRWGVQAHRALLQPAAHLGLGIQGGATEVAGEPGHPGMKPRDSWGIRSNWGCPLRCVPSALPAAPPRAFCKDLGEVLGSLEGLSSLSHRPQGRPTSPRPRPRWRLHAPPAVAAQPPRSNHLITFPLRGAARLLPATLPRARCPRRSPPPTSRRPARGPGSPRSPALDNALVKTAELFLTSPPPLLIKAPP